MTRPLLQSFLLRLWREEAGAPLRATLIPIIEPAAPRHFATLEALAAFLRAQAGQVPLGAEGKDAPDCTPSESR